MSFHESRRRWLLIAGAVTVAAAVTAARASAQTMPGIAVPRAGIANASTPAAGAILGGFTSQGWPAVLDIAKNGKGIRLIVAGLEMKCTSGEQFAIQDGFVGLAIARNGNVHATQAVKPSTGRTVTLTGGSDSLSGRFNRERSAFLGSWDLHLSFQTSTGQTDECDSGRVSLAARL